MKKLKIYVFIGLTLLINSNQVSAMALFDFMKICVFTDVDGVVTFEGKPVSGARLVRTAVVVFNNEEFKDEVVTDSEGKFHFDSIYSYSVNAFLPSAKMVEQNIVINYQENDYQAWEVTKNNYDYNGELNYLDQMDDLTNIYPLVLHCEITDDRLVRSAPNNKYVAVAGICRLQNE